MIAFFAKIIFLFAGVLAMMWFATNHVPGFRERALALISPRAKEATLLKTLSRNLDALETGMSRKAPGSGSDGETQRLIADSRKLAAEIDELNAENSGLLKEGFSKLAEMTLGRTPAPSPSTAQGAALNSSAVSPAPGGALPSPCP